MFLLLVYFYLEDIKPYAFSEIILKDVTDNAHLSTNHHLSDASLRCSQDFGNMSAVGENSSLRTQTDTFPGP